MKQKILILLILIPFIVIGKETNTDTLETNINGKGVQFVIEFEKGKKHHYPLMVFWIEDVNGKYIQPVYVPKSVATGVYQYADTVKGEWQSGERRLPATLPYWSHKRGIKAKDGLYMPDPETPVPDAYSGATPQGNFLLNTKTDKKLEKFVLLMEINRFFDFNDYYTNMAFAKVPGYKTSGQPALVYAVTVDLNNPIKEYYLNPIGHSHIGGQDGLLYTDLSKITTALQMVKSIKVIIKN